MPPKAIGVLAIVFGALALPGTVVCAYVVDNATTCAKKPRHDARRDQGVDRCRRRRAVAEKWATSIGGAWAAFGVLLLLSGVGLVRRKRWGVVVGYAWAIGALGATVVSLVLLIKDGDGAEVLFGGLALAVAPALMLVALTRRGTRDALDAAAARRSRR